MCVRLVCGQSLVRFSCPAKFFHGTWSWNTTNFPTVATFCFQCKFPYFSFWLNQPHQRKWKYFHPLGIFSFKRFVSCQFTYWRPAHYLNDPFSITKQLSLDLASQAVKFDWSLVISCECSQGQFRLLGSLGANTCFKCIKRQQILLIWKMESHHFIVLRKLFVALVTIIVVVLL